MFAYTVQSLAMALHIKGILAPSFFLDLILCEHIIFVIVEEEAYCSECKLDGQY